MVHVPMLSSILRNIAWSNPFQPSVAFHIETSHLKINWLFLYEMQHWAEMGREEISGEY